MAFFGIKNNIGSIPKELPHKGGHTPLDQEEKEGPKIKLITTQGELDEFEQFNIEKAVEWTIRTKFIPENILSKKFIKDLPIRMFGDVWKLAGEFRESKKRGLSLKPSRNFYTKKTPSKPLPQVYPLFLRNRPYRTGSSQLSD